MVSSPASAAAWCCGGGREDRCAFAPAHKTCGKSCNERGLDAEAGICRATPSSRILLSETGRQPERPSGISSDSVIARFAVEPAQARRLDRHASGVSAATMLPRSEESTFRQAAAPARACGATRQPGRDRADRPMLRDRRAPSPAANTGRRTVSPSMTPRTYAVMASTSCTQRRNTTAVTMKATSTASTTTAASETTSLNDAPESAAAVAGKSAIGARTLSSGRWRMMIQSNPRKRGTTEVYRSAPAVRAWAVRKPSEARMASARHRTPTARREYRAHARWPARS